jgi:transcriptional regulator with XRE-family HTH domain
MIYFVLWCYIMKINEIIKLLMTSRNVTATKLASDIDMTRQTIYRFLNGDCSIAHDKLLLILNYFDLDIETLASRKLMNQSVVQEHGKIGADIETLLSYIDELQRTYHINYLVTLCQNDLAKRPDPKIKKAISNVKKYYLGAGR